MLAAGEKRSVVDHLTIPIQMCALVIEHPFIAVDSLITLYGHYGNGHILQG